MKTHGFSDKHHINHHFPYENLDFPYEHEDFSRLYEAQTTQGSHQGYPTHLHHLASTLPFGRSDGARSIHQQHPLRQDGLATCHEAWFFFGISHIYIYYV